MPSSPISEANQYVLLAAMHTETSRLHKQAARTQARLACLYEHLKFNTYAEMARNQERYETDRAAYLIQKGEDILNKTASSMPMMERTNYEAEFIRKFRRKIDLLEWRDLKGSEKTAISVLMNLQTPDVGLEPTTTR